jgi:hypothetical protein
LTPTCTGCTPPVMRSVTPVRTVGREGGLGALSACPAGTPMTSRRPATTSATPTALSCGDHPPGPRRDSVDIRRAGAMTGSRRRGRPNASPPRPRRRADALAAFGVER